MANNVITIIKNCCMQISELMRTKHTNVLSSIMSDSNLSGDEVKQLDILSNKILLNALVECNSIRYVGSEEEHDLVPASTAVSAFPYQFAPMQQLVPWRQLSSI